MSCGRINPFKKLTPVSGVTTRFVSKLWDGIFGALGFGINIYMDEFNACFTRQIGQDGTSKSNKTNTMSTNQAVVFKPDANSRQDLYTIIVISYIIHTFLGALGLLN